MSQIDGVGQAARPLKLRRISFTASLSIGDKGENLRKIIRGWEKGRRDWIRRFCALKGLFWLFLMLKEQ